MASSYKRGRFWWIKYRHPRTGEIRYESSGLLVGSTKHARKIMELVAERTLAERRSRGIVAKERWFRWVPTFLDERYRNKPQSRLRYRIAWNTIRQFLDVRQILAPRFLTREDCYAYIEWRQADDPRRMRYRAGHNTALLEIKTLGMVMKEAVFRGYAPANPCRELGIQRLPGKIKSALNEEEITTIRKCIAEQPEPMRTFLSNSFEIARYQGCRLSETHLNPMRDVDIEVRRITFRAKGGKTHVTRLHDKLVPLFRELRGAGVTETYVRPKSPAKTWYNFLRSTGVKDSNPNLCFHSTRVLVATELARANVHESKAMRYLGHASTTVHRSYQRLRPDDLGDAVDAISDGAPPPKQKNAARR